jgi:hypothetical protein
MKQWEYIEYTKELYDEDNEQKLTNFGRIGWELVSVIYNSETNRTIHYFKREVIQPEFTPFKKTQKSGTGGIDGIRINVTN